MLRLLLDEQQQQQLAFLTAVTATGLVPDCHFSSLAEGGDHPVGLR